MTMQYQLQAADNGVEIRNSATPFVCDRATPVRHAQLLNFRKAANN